MKANNLEDRKKFKEKNKRFTLAELILQANTIEELHKIVLEKEFNIDLELIEK